MRKPWFQLEGGGLVEADLRLAQGRLASGSTLDIPRVEAVAQVAGTRLAGVAKAHGHIDDAATPQAHLDVGIPTFRATPSDAPRQVLLDGRDLQLAMQGDAELARLRETMKAQLRFSDARVPDLTVYNRYLSGKTVRLLGGSGRLSGDVALNAAGEVGNGHADLRGQGAHLSIAGIQMRGDAQLQANLRRADFKAKFFDLSGTHIRLRNMRVGDAAPMPPGGVRWRCRPARFRPPRPSRWMPMRQCACAMPRRCCRCSHNAPITRAGCWACWMPASSTPPAGCAGASSRWWTTCTRRTHACRCARAWQLTMITSEATCICAGACLVQASSSMANSANGI